jgi:hypothetical protein
LAKILTVYIVDAGDDTIKVGHQFFGLTEREVETYKREHLASCEYFRSAENEQRTIEEMEDVGSDELPDPEDFEDDDDQ